MRIITLNVNGIRAAARKGFFEWAKAQNADVICVQELKAQAEDILQLPCPEGHQAFYHYAEKKGYSGVGIYARCPVYDVATGLGWEVADREGRYIAVDLGGLWVSSLYMPSGTSGEERQTIKFDFLSRYLEHLRQLKKSRRPMIICGDWNIAHRPIDLKNWRANQTHSGFLPEERAYLDTVFDEMGFVDAFRVVNSQAEQYTWWSHRGRAWEKNVGWRIDYQVISPGTTVAVRAAQIYKETRFSDHAPLIIEYNRRLI